MHFGIDSQRFLRVEDMTKFLSIAGGVAVGFIVAVMFLGGLYSVARIGYDAGFKRGFARGFDQAFRLVERDAIYDAAYDSERDKG